MDDFKVGDKVKVLSAPRNFPIKAGEEGVIVRTGMGTSYPVDIAVEGQPRSLPMALNEIERVEK